MGGCVKGLCVKGGAELSRRQIDDYTAFVGRFGAKGLAWIKMTHEGPTSSIVKFFDKPLLDRLVAQMGAKENDLLLFVAAEESTVNQSLDHLRRRLGKDLGLIDPDRYEFAWITEFPLMQWDKRLKIMPANTIRLHCPMSTTSLF